MAFKTINNKPAFQWWSAYIDKEEAPELKQVAEKVGHMPHATDACFCQAWSHMCMRGALCGLKV